MARKVSLWRRRRSASEAAGSAQRAHRGDAPRAALVTAPPSRLSIRNGRRLQHACRAARPVTALTLWFAAFGVQDYGALRFNLQLAFFALKITTPVRFHPELLLLCLIIGCAKGAALVSKQNERRRQLSTSTAFDERHLMNSAWCSRFTLMRLLSCCTTSSASRTLAYHARSMLVSFFGTAFENGAFQDVVECQYMRMRSIEEVCTRYCSSMSEATFGRTVCAVRTEELSTPSHVVSFTGASHLILLQVSPVVVSSSSFAAYTIVLCQSRTPGKEFTAVTLFNTCRDLLQELSSVVSRCIHAKLSMTRTIPSQQYLGSVKANYKLSTHRMGIIKKEKKRNATVSAGADARAEDMENKARNCD